MGTPGGNAMLVEVLDRPLLDDAGDHEDHPDQEAPGTAAGPCGRSPTSCATGMMPQRLQARMMKSVSRSGVNRILVLLIVCMTMPSSMKSMADSATLPHAGGAPGPRPGSATKKMASTIARRDPHQEHDLVHGEGALPNRSAHPTAWPTGGNSSPKITEVGASLTAPGFRPGKASASGHVAELPEEEPEVGHQDRDAEGQQVDPAGVLHQEDDQGDEAPTDGEADQGDASTIMLRETLAAHERAAAESSRLISTRPTATPAEAMPSMPQKIAATTTIGTSRPDRLSMSTASLAARPGGASAAACGLVRGVGDGGAHRRVVLGGGLKSLASCC